MPTQLNPCHHRREELLADCRRRCVLHDHNQAGAQNRWKLDPAHQTARGSRFLKCSRDRPIRASCRQLPVIVRLALLLSDCLTLVNPLRIRDLKPCARRFPFALPQKSQRWSFSSKKGYLSLFFGRLQKTYNLSYVNYCLE